jgi:pyrimidine-nucleoside phosphorylase
VLGAGRNTMEDRIDFTAGIRLAAKTGDYVRAGDPIATLYASDERLFDAAEQRFLSATTIGDERPAELPLVLERIEAS